MFHLTGRINWIGALTMSLLLKLPPQKLETRFILRISLYLWKSTEQPCIDIVVMYGFVLPIAIWI